ncbi:hypothetical protein JCM3766R1_002203 [Sporobolomyces carnicolor]
MLNRLHRVRIPLHQLVQPPPAPPTRAPCRLCSTAQTTLTTTDDGTRAAGRGVRDKGKGKAAVVDDNTTKQPVDWSRPSTSAVPYSLTAAATNDDATKPSHRPIGDDDLPPLVDLLDTDARGGGHVAVSTLVRAFEAAVATVDRDTFDRVFDRVARSTSNQTRHLRHVRAIGEKRRGWRLTERQVRTILAASLRREREGRIKAMLAEEKALVDSGGTPDVEAVERAIWAQRRRQNMSDALFDEYLDLVSDPTRVAKRERAAVADVLHLFATCAAIRPVSTTRDQDGRAVLAFSLSLDYSTAAVRRATVIEHDLSIVVARMFAHGRRDEAFAILTKMAGKRRVLSVGVMRDLVKRHYEDQSVKMSDLARRSDADDVAHFEPAPRDRRSRFDPAPGTTNVDDEYSHAREILDQACSLPSSSASETGPLDELLRLRLERVDRLEELDKNPRGAFLKWLVACGGPDRLDSIETALRMWRAGLDDDRDDDVSTSYRKVLEELVIKACRVAAIARTTESPTTTSSPVIEYAVELAIEYFPLQVLIHHSHALLSALTVDSYSPSLAVDLFNVVNAPPVTFAFAPFQWSAALVVPFTRMFFSAGRYERDASLAMRLYLSWTASGLTFPAGLWDPLWRSLGHGAAGGGLDDLERVLYDWEETGRGPAESRIVRHVLHGAVKSGNVPKALEVFAYLRSRYAPTSFERSRRDPRPVSQPSADLNLSIFCLSSTSSPPL